MLWGSKFGQVYSYIDDDAILAFGLMQTGTQLDYLTLVNSGFEIYTPFSIYHQERKKQVHLFGSWHKTQI